MTLKRDDEHFIGGHFDDGLSPGTENVSHSRERDLLILAETLEQRVRERTRQVRELASRLTRAEQKERNRIAHILHDDLQQVLVSVQMRLRILIETKKLAPEDAEELQKDLDESIEMSRTLTVDLSPPVLRHEGLAQSFAWLRSQMAKRHHFDLSVTAADGIPAQDAPTRAMVFQVVRELVLNVVKHAGVNHAAIDVRQANGSLQIVVKDEGSGFDPAGLMPESKGEGFGLVQAREQLELYGGTLTLESAPGEGCRALIEMPLAENQEGA